MHLRLKMKFLGAILVHPVRCQNFCWQIAPLILQHPRLWLIKNLVENWEICTFANVSTAANRIKMKNLCSSSIFKPKRALQCWFEQLPSSREPPSSAKWPAFNYQHTHTATWRWQGAGAAHPVCELFEQYGYLSLLKMRRRNPWVCEVCTGNPW